MKKEKQGKFCYSKTAGKGDKTKEEGHTRRRSTRMRKQKTYKFNVVRVHTVILGGQKFFQNLQILVFEEIVGRKNHLHNVHLDQQGISTNVMCSVVAAYPTTHNKNKSHDFHSNSFHKISD